MHLTAFIINPFVLEMIANCLRIVKPPVRHISLRNKKAGRQCDNTLPAGDCFEKETCIFSVDLFLGKQDNRLDLFFIVQTNTHVFLDNRQLKFDGF